MDTLLAAAQVLLPVAYLAASAAYSALFFGAPPRDAPAARGGFAAAATPLLAGTVLLHLGYLTALVAHHRQFPAATVSQALSCVAFAVAAVYLFVEWHGRERSTGFWLVSLAFAFQLLASVLVRPHPPSRDIFHDPFFATHVSLALLGYAAFAVAAGYAFLFLMLYRDLKGGRFSTFYGKLPPLEVLERMMTAALWAGFLALTAAVVVGAVWAERLDQTGWVRDPKIAFTLATWVLYATALLLKRLRRWQGRQTALASLTGLGAILFSLVAVNLFFTDFHGFL
ncbi:MAG TPA: cytochrome c biogenesis protein CcsA [Thermoanaerobaculia bacterium]|nr:cytochrome c biogenesis protein CcsA [Thermoanaerobaculia bacterium]